MITNDDQLASAQLTVFKQVVNDNGGTAVPADFTITVTSNGTALASFAGSATGTLRTLSAGTYSVAEAAVAGYAATLSAGCAGTLALGQTQTCTITNNDLAAPTYAVNSFLDEADLNLADGVCATAGGLCSLRAAIQQANATAGAETVGLATGTYTLTIVGAGEDAALTGDLDITDDLTITGAGAASTIVIAGTGFGDRIFEMPFLHAPTVTISSLTIEGGSITDGHGGGMRQDAGSLTLVDVDFVGNTATYHGGGLHGAVVTQAPSPLSLRISGGAFRENVAGQYGGGIFLAASATLSDVTITGNTAVNGGGFYHGGIIDDGRNLELLPIVVERAVITGNHALSEGGGIFASLDGDRRIIDSTISGNDAQLGGGITASGAVTLERTLVAGNTALYNGGGIHHQGVGPLTVRNVTISGNAAGFNNPQPYKGGGVVSYGRTPDHFTNVTIAGNTPDGLMEDAAFGGGAIVENVIVADGCSFDLVFGITSLGHNLDSGTSCGFNQSTDQSRADPLLGPLADNGGPTQTRALMAGSTAIDRGAAANCPATDQRGFTRPQDGDGNGSAICDIGAFELAAQTPTPGPLDHLVLSPATATISVGGSQTYTARGADASNNDLGELTASTTFTIAPDGSCSANSCTATLAGEHSVTGTSSGKTGTATLTVTVTPAGTLQFRLASDANQEIGGPHFLSATRFGGSQGAVGVTVATTASGTATGGDSCTAGVDFINLTTTTLAWADGETQNQGTALIVCSDAEVEPDETVNLVLSSPTGGATLGTPSTMVYTIMNDD